MTLKPNQKEIVAIATDVVAAHLRGSQPEFDLAFAKLITHAKAFKMSVEEQTAQPPNSETTLKFGKLSINGGTRKVKYGDTSVAMSHLEFEMLHYLASNPERVFSRDRLLDVVWGPTRYVVDRSVDVYIRRIRQKLRIVGAPDYVRTIRGTGYVFDKAVK